MFRVGLQSQEASVTAPHHGGASHGGIQFPHDTPPPSDAKVSFFDNLLGKLDSGSISQKKYLVFHTYL